MVVIVQGHVRYVLGFIHMPPRYEMHVLEKNDDSFNLCHLFISYLGWVGINGIIFTIWRLLRCFQLSL